MKRYTIEIQNCMEVKVDANSPEEARQRLVESDDLWFEDFLNTATIFDSIKEEEI